MNHTYLKSLFLATVVIPLLSFAGVNQDRYPVGIRPTPQKEVQQEASANFFSRTYPAVYFPSGMHSLLAVSAWGESIEIEDGSRWKIASYDRSKVASWGAQDPILITQNHRWFSHPFSYRIINQATGGILEAYLELGPFKDGPYTRYIQHIDLLSHEVVLNDATRWQISMQDANDLYSWHLYDAVIIGYNSGWDTETSPGLLINVNKNQHVQVKQF